MNININDLVYHYCVVNLSEGQPAIVKEIVREKNLAMILVSDLFVWVTIDELSLVN